LKPSPLATPVTRLSPGQPLYGVFKVQRLGSSSRLFCCDFSLACLLPRVKLLRSVALLALKPSTLQGSRRLTGYGVVRRADMENTNTRSGTESSRVSGLLQKSGLRHFLGLLEAETASVTPIN